MHQYWQHLLMCKCLSVSPNLQKSYCPWMALHYCQNFVSAQYLENKLTESDQILYTHQQQQDLAWDCCPSFFAKFWRSYGPWLTSEFCFRSISWVTEYDQILYAYQHWQDLAWDCYPSFFAKFWRSYGPWLTSKFCFRLISWERIHRIRPNFVCTSTLTRSSLGLLSPVYTFTIFGYGAAMIHHDL